MAQQFYSASKPKNYFNSYYSSCALKLENTFQRIAVIKMTPLINFRVKHNTVE